MNLRELEIYKKNLEYIANLQGKSTVHRFKNNFLLSDDELEKVEFYADRQEDLMSSLSDLSRAAGEKWEWLLKKKNKNSNNKDVISLKADQANQAILDKCKSLDGCLN